MVCDSTQSNMHQKCISEASWCFTPNQLTTWRQHTAMFCVEIKSMLNGNQHTMLKPSPLSLLYTKSDDYLDF